MAVKKHAIVLSILFISTVSLFAQEEAQRDDWKKIHMAGFSYNHSYKLLEETIGDDTLDLTYSIESLGLNYSSFSGARLGFVTDATILIPFMTSYDSESGETNSGFMLDYVGSVGWRLEFAPFTLIPYVGFHGDYCYLSRDPVDDNMPNHMISIGIGTGIKGIYEIADGKGVFLGLRATYNSLEFSTADYDSREIQLIRKFTFMLNAGYSWRPRYSS